MARPSPQRSPQERSNGVALKDRIATDIDRVFLRMDHFAETHYWNGEEILCVPDEQEALKRKNNNVNDISWDANTRKIVIYVKQEDFPGGDEPEPNTHVIFDRKPMRILDVHNNMGMLDILLESRDPRELI